MRPRRITLLLLAVLLICAGVLPGASAQEEPVLVIPYADGQTFEATTDDNIHIYWAWIAATRGQVRVFLNAVEDSYLLTDDDGTTWLDLSTTDAQAYWSSPFSAPPAILGWDCPMPRIWASSWDFEVGQLPAGTYTLVTVDDRSHPMNDGTHLCRIDGYPLSQPPSLNTPGTQVWTVTLEVTQAP